MAELPELNQEAIEQALGGAAPAGGPPAAAPAGAPPGAEASGGLPSTSEIDDILSALDDESLVPPPEEPSGPDYSGLKDIMDGLQRGEQDDEKMLLANRVAALEERLVAVNQQHRQEQINAEQNRVRGAINKSVRNAIGDISVGHEKLDQAAAAFIEGALVYKLAQQAQNNPQAKADADAIKRFANKSAKALSRWAKEHAKKDAESQETRRAQAGTQSRPKVSDFELKTDADFDKYVAAFIGKGG